LVDLTLGVSVPQLSNFGQRRTVVQEKVKRAFDAAKRLQESRPDQYSGQFKMITDHGRIAFEAEQTLWNNAGKHVGLLAPTIDALGQLYQKVTGEAMDRRRVQSVRIVGRRRT
jgi:hypothetical protein